MANNNFDASFALLYKGRTPRKAERSTSDTYRRGDKTDNESTESYDSRFYGHHLFLLP